MQMRAYLSPSVTESKDAHGAPNRDLTLLVTHDRTLEEVKLAVPDHIASSTFEIERWHRRPLPAGRLPRAVRRPAPQRKVLAPVAGQGRRVGGVLGYNLHTTGPPQAGPEGPPPLGVEAAMWVFLWAELAAVLALALLVFKWAKADPRSLSLSERGSEVRVTPSPPARIPDRPGLRGRRSTRRP